MEIVLEAAAAGLPTVGTRVGHVAELSPHAALAVPPGDAAALARGICCLLEDGTRRREMAAAAKRFADQHDADASAQAFAALYRELLRGG